MPVVRHTERSWIHVSAAFKGGGKISMVDEIKGEPSHPYTEQFRACKIVTAKSGKTGYNVPGPYEKSVNFPALSLPYGANRSDVKHRLFN